MVTAPAKARRLVAAVPASYVAFDLLAVAGVDLRTQGRTVRRGRLEQLATSERFVVDKSNADDLRDRRFTLADPVNEIVISEDVAAALRELRLLDGDCEQLVFRIRARNDGAVLPATDDGLDS